MPRPKRTKLALSASAAPMRVANSKQKNARQLELSSTTSSDRVHNNSDDSEGLVTTRKVKAGSRGDVEAQATTMSGALAPGDPVLVRPKPLGGRKRPVLPKTGRDADHDRAIEALKARRDAALAAERGLAPVEPKLAEKSPARGRATVRAEEKNPSAGVVTDRIVQATPRMAPSVLEASNFKRRHRQPSLLRVIQAQANRQSEDEDDDLDDFQPDDESMPFLKSKSQAGQYISPSPPPVQSAQTSSSRKRKHTSPEVNVPMSQPVDPVLASSPSRSLTPAPELDDEEESIHSIPSSNPNSNPEPSLPFLRHEPTKSAPQALDSDTLAPPLSSSPVPSPHPKTPKSKSIRGNPPSPSPRPTLQPTASRALKPLSTVSLQNLLPRRRLRFNPAQHGDGFDLPDSSDLEIDTTGLGEDEDELTVHAKMRVKGRNRDRRPEKGAWAAETGKRKKKMQPQRKEKETQNATARKTYSHHNPLAAAVSDDDDDENENPEEEDDVDSDVALASTARAKAGGGAKKEGNTTTSELKRLARKFREVDEWTLDIEDVTGSGSSQKDAR